MPAPRPDQRIDPVEWQERVDRMSELMSSMIVVADELATRRCPYRSRTDRCTAHFGCRNQRRPSAELEASAPLRDRGLMLCSGDDKLDYRDAWETDDAA